MPPISSVHLDRPLTDFSIGYLAEPSDFAVGDVFPIVPVDQKSNKYYILDRNPFARGDARPRGVNAESAGFEFTMSNDSYSCVNYAMHTDLDKHLIETADNPQMVEEGATRLVVDNIRLTHEVSWATKYFAPSIWGTDLDLATAAGVAPWNDYANSDPKRDIKAAIRKIKTAGGFMPNVLAVGFDVWQALEDHPLIIDRVKHVSDAPITEAIVARYLGVDKLVVLKSTKATNAVGQTETYDFVHGKSALLCYAAKSPGMLAPSAGYVFSWKGTSAGGVMATDGTAAVSVIDMPLRKSNRYEVEMNWDDKVTGVQLGYFFQNAA